MVSSSIRITEEMSNSILLKWDSKIDLIDAFASVMADLVMPTGGAKASRVQSKDLGIALAVDLDAVLHACGNAVSCSAFHHDVPLVERCSERRPGPDSSITLLPGRLAGARRLTA